MRLNSFCAREIKEKRTTQPHVLPIYPTSSYQFDNLEQGMAVFKGEQEGHIYGRFGNPTVEAVATKIATLESYGLDFEASGMLFSSGMSAISTVLLAIVKSGDTILTQGNLYGGTTALLTKILQPLGIKVQMINLQNLQQVQDALKNNATIRAIYFETPANPTMSCVDMEALATLAQKYKVKTIADNTFCTPYIQQPLRFGIDVVVHSTTKYINGHGNSIAGAAIAKDPNFMQNEVLTVLKLVGTNCNPWDAWLTHQGMKTLALRMQQHTQNAISVANFLVKHPKVSHVNYVGLPTHPDYALAEKQMRMPGGMLSFELKNGFEAGIRFMNRLQLCTMAPTLGDTDTLVMHPASMSHSSISRELRLANGITDGLIRLSIGIEDKEDILEDLDHALK